MAVAEFVDQSDEGEAALLKHLRVPALVGGIELGGALVAIIGRAHRPEQRNARPRRTGIGPVEEIGVEAVISHSGGILDAGLGAQWAGLVLDIRVALVEAGRRVQRIVGDIDDVGDLGEFGRRGQQGLDFVLIWILDRDLGRNGRIGIRIEIALAGEIDVDDVLARVAEGVALDGGRIRRRFPGRSRAFHAVRIAHRNMLAVDEDAAPVDRVERARNVIMRGIGACRSRFWRKSRNRRRNPRPRRRYCRRTWR